VRLREARSVVWSASAQEKAAQAELALAQTEICAPFAGTISQIDIEVGERVNPGRPVLVLAALDRLRVRTTDLMELDMARIADGQPVVVTVDALPDVTLAGYVKRIHGRSVEVRGDVTYPVYVALEETALALRWGMTTMVEIGPME